MHEATQMSDAVCDERRPERSGAVHEATNGR